MADFLSCTLKDVDCDEAIVVFSDIEMGTGGDRDDFPHTPFFGELLCRYLEGPLANHPLHFVFNGDTFDLLKTAHKGGFPHHITSEIASNKMSKVILTHPLFFEAIRAVMDHPSGNKEVSFVVGNHDAELLFPEVQALIQNAVRSSRPVNFPGFHLDLGPVWFEHGSQLDPLFCIDTDKPFVHTDKGELLNISWAMITLLDVFMPLHPMLYFYDRLCPKDELMVRLPEMKDLLMSRAWRYWSKDFWYDLLVAKDPVLDLTWPIVKETIRRFTLGNPDVSLNSKWIKQTIEVEPQEVYVLGHTHRAGSFYHGAKRVIQSGCLRDEYFVGEDGESFFPVLKGYFELFVKDGRVVEIIAREFMGPPRPAHNFPKSIHTMLPDIRKLIAEDGET